MSSMASQNNINIPQNIQPQTQIPSYQNIPKIRVIVRKRPLGKKEIAKNDTDVVEIRNNKQVVVKELKVKVDLTKYVEEHAFNFDLAFDENVTNEQIYLQTVRPMIEAAFHKTKVTCFAYGQTGSGKTFTMMGNKKQIPGLYLLAAYDIFSLLQNYQNFSIWISFYEIYCGKLFDLLNERKILTAREDGKQNICIAGLTEKNVTDLNVLMQIIEYGLNCRTVGVTGANADSSRSHGIIQIKIKDCNLKDYGKISFIDLAGSERAADTIDVNKQTKFDGAEINKSLLALKECIRALDQDKKHTPFRGSKLTLVLRDSFIGNCKTLMIANISPALGCSEHTLNTLRYADRVKELRAKPDIKLGQGNVNLNFIKNEKMGLPEDLATIMMMPRQHNNTIKYEVDNNMQKIRKLKTFKPKIKKSPNKIMENNVFNNNNNYNNFNNIGIENNNMNSMNFFNSFPPIANNNFNSNNCSQNFNNNEDNKYNMMNSNNNQIQEHNFQSQKGINLNQNDLIPNDIDVNSILKMSGIKNANNNSINNNIISNNNNYYPPKNLNNIFNNFNDQQIKYSNTENKENLQNNNPNNTQQKQYFSEKKTEENILNQQIQKQNLKIQSSIKKEKFISKNSGSIGFAFLNDYTSFINKDNNKKNKNNSNKKNNMELNELKEKYEKIVNDILNEEKNCLENHKSHIDDMVITMKNEMNLINIVEQKSNVDEYVDEILNIFGEQENKINLMKQKLLGFKRLLKEENELSQKISAFKDNKDNNSNNDLNTKIENNYDKNENESLKKSIKLEERNEDY